MYNAREIEKKWQERWEASNLFESDPDPNKKKKFITIPYPYASGTMHIGHGRSYVNGDIFARYYRAKGYNVLFPMAFHITGTPVLAISSSLERGEKNTFDKMRDYVAIHTSSREKVDKIVESFIDPWNIVKYFSAKMKIDLKSIGMSLDWRREFTTGDKIYNRFIEWQFQKLGELEYLEMGEYPILYCPRCMNAVGEDDIASGDELDLSINEYITIKFPYEDGYLVPATLRPETIYGVTNLWINPEGTYVKALVNDENWIISEEAVMLLQNQNKQITIKETFKGAKLIGKKCKSLENQRELLILPGTFVDTSMATGVVYSVPAHAPFDFIALNDLQKDEKVIKKFNLNYKEINEIQPIIIITLEGFEDYPAKIYCEKYQVFSQNDKDKLDKATSENYKYEYYNGVLNDSCGKYAGINVNEALNLVIENLVNQNKADKLYIPITKDLRCRCGEKINITILRDQWFLNFNAGKWKESAFECLDKMIIIPEKYRINFINIFNWLEKRPCARKRGLGTKLPFDNEWIIESLSDSTIYMSFYTIAHILNGENITPEQLIPEFFDYVFLEEGEVNEISIKTKIKAELLEKMQREFLYWYPVDHRHTAIMHISNHLSFYIFHHVAIYPEKHWPKVITLIEPLIREGQKMGKSKGNIISLADIKEKYSADLFRFYISHSADLGISVDWREKKISILKTHIERFYNFMRDQIAIVKNINGKYGDIKTKFAKVVLSKFIRYFIDADESLKQFNLRRYLQISFYECFNLIQDFKKFAEEETDFHLIFQIIYLDWIKMLSITMPHLSEELWEYAGNNELVSQTTWSEFNTDYIDEDLESEFDYINQLVEDIMNIKKILKSQEYQKIYIYTSEQWKYQVKELVFTKKDDLNQIIDELKRKKILTKDKHIISFVKELIKNRIWERKIPQIDETRLLNEYKPYIENKVGKELEINSNYDPKIKLSKAKPLKPAIYIPI